MKSIIIPGGVSITQLAHIEDHFLHVVAVRSDLKFTNLHSFMKKVNPRKGRIKSYLGIQGKIVEDHRADKRYLTRLKEKMII